MGFKNMKHFGQNTLNKTSYKPGRISLPLASIVFDPPGMTRFVPICLKIKQIHIKMDGLSIDVFSLIYNIFDHICSNLLLKLFIEKLKESWVIFLNFILCHNMISQH